MIVPQHGKIVYFSLLVSALALWGWVASHKQASAGPARVYHHTPTYTFFDPKEQHVTGTQHRGKWVLLNYWATWCPPCRAEMPSLERLARRAPKLTVLAASVNKSWKPIRKYFGKHPTLRMNRLRMQLVLDKQRRYAARYGTKKFPETYLIDPYGILRYKFVGPFHWDSPAMLAQLKKLMGSLR